MSSEPSQPSGWPPADWNDPADESGQQRGFGLFEPPAAPEEFPVFTPYSSSASDSDFPPDSESFGGFPSDNLPPVSETPDWGTSDSYVPAPAVMPIPGVRHDSELSPPSWSSTPEVPAAYEPFQAATDWASSIPEAEPAPSGSWSAFAAGESRKQASAPAAEPWNAPSDPPAWQPPAASETPSWQSAAASETPSWQAAAPETPSWQSAASDLPSRQPGASEPPAWESDLPSRQPGATETPSWQSSAEAPAWTPAPETPHYQPAAEAPAWTPAAEPPAWTPAPETPAWTPAAETPSWHSPSEPEPAPQAAPAWTSPAEPVQPAPAEQPAADGTGRVRVAASVPPTSRIDPSEAPAPALPKSAGRVYGSATAQVPQQIQPEDSADSAQIPVTPPQPARATARAAVSVPRPPADMPPPPPQAARSSTVYGSPSASMAPPAPVDAPRQPGRPPYSDLISPQGMPPAGPPPLQGPGPQGLGPQGPGPQGPGHQGMPSGMPHGQQPMVPQQRGPMQQHPGGPGSDEGKPAQTSSSLPDQKPERKGRLILGVLVGCVALLAIAFGGLILVDKLIVGGTAFKVDDCLKKDASGSSEAIVAQCTEPEAFRVTGMVASATECPDPTMPTVQQRDGEILCLVPANAASAPTASSTPSPKASATPN